MLCLQEIIFYLVELPVRNNELITKADFLIADCFVSAGRQNAYHDEKCENLTLLAGWLRDNWHPGHVKLSNIAIRSSPGCVRMQRDKRIKFDRDYKHPRSKRLNSLTNGWRLTMPLHTSQAVEPALKPGPVEELHGESHRLSRQKSFTKMPGYLENSRDQKIIDHL